MIGHVSDLGENFDKKSCREVNVFLHCYIKCEATIWQETQVTKLKPKADLEKSTKFLYPGR